MHETMSGIEVDDTPVRHGDHQEEGGSRGGVGVIRCSSSGSRP